MSLHQDEVRSNFESLEKGAWTVVCDGWHDADRNGGIYCAFAPQSRREKAVSNPAWDVTKSDFRPGFSTYSEGDTRVTRYMPGSIRGEIEPLVLFREYYGLAPSAVELVEQFRLYHNLYWDELSSQFMQPHDDGTQSVAVKITGYRVVVRTKLLRQYQAARQLDLLLFIDSIEFGDEDEELPPTTEWESALLRASLHSSAGMLSDRPFSRYLGTRVVPPPPIEKSGIWPYEEPDDYYPEFIIGIDEDGDEVTYTCNHDALANYFGANPDAPHYLTPVHFRREVLQKYYEKPERYTVADGNLKCAGLWSVRIDNSAEQSVVVFLGDLGRDLPKQERDYWRSFNIPPESPVSETLIRRAFLGQFTEPGALDLQVRSNYIALRKAWVERYGWELFREPQAADAGLLQRLRVPLDESQAEFETSIRIMTQLFVDAVNEQQVQAGLPDKRENEKGIAKLERWLQQEDYPHVQRDIQFLRNLQEARSKITAHRKGSDYEKTLDKVFGDLRGIAAIKTFFEAALAMLTGLAEWLAANNEEGSSTTRST